MSRLHQLALMRNTNITPILVTQSMTGSQGGHREACFACGQLAPKLPSRVARDGIYLGFSLTDLGFQFNTFIPSQQIPLMHFEEEHPKNI